MIPSYASASQETAMAQMAAGASRKIEIGSDGKKNRRFNVQKPPIKFQRS